MCWNLITEHKVLLAEGLLGIPLFDVSPGEMYFASLERYFSENFTGTATHFLVTASLEAWEGPTRIFARTWDAAVPRSEV